MVEHFEKLFNTSVPKGQYKHIQIHIKIGKSKRAEIQR